MKTLLHSRWFWLIGALMGVHWLAMDWVVGQEPDAPPRQPAAAPATLTYQGRLTDLAGTPLTGSYTMTFRLYAAESGGSPLWGPETHTVAVDGGLFTVQLGSQGAPLTPAVLGEPTYLEIEVDGQVLAPRRPVTSVPYALVAASVAPGAVISASLPGAALTVSHEGDGDGLAARSALTGTAAIRASSDYGQGVAGSTAGVGTFVEGTAGVYGSSVNNGTFGVLGYSRYGVPVEGNVLEAGNYNPAVVGWNVGSGSGVYGVSVVTGTAGLWGSSTYGAGVIGYSYADGGVVGESTLGYGVYARSAMTHALYVSGSAYFAGPVTFASGFTTTPLVEQYTPVGTLEPGDVVIIDPAVPLGLSLTDRAYDTRVAGVLAPGGRASLALIGQARVKVDAAYGPIKPGDLLTTSPTPGYAMAADDPLRAAGAIIGKALESWANGQGVILMLVMSR